MDARICGNPACRTIQTAVMCHLCKATTTPLPKLSLAPIGLNGEAHLTHTHSHGYSIVISTPSNPRPVYIPISDLVQAAQPILPHINPVSGLHIMDTLKRAAGLIKTKNTAHWAGWVLYLLETLQDHAHATDFQEMLTDLCHDISNLIVENDIPPRAP